MRVLTSAVRPSGHLVIARIPEGAKVSVSFVDEADPAEERDVTAMLPELILTGALDAAEARNSSRPEPVEQVEVAVVRYSEPVTPGQVHAPASFTWLHAPSGECGDFEPGEVLGLVVRGITVELTAGVAAEAADVPDDPSTVTNER